LRGRDVRKIFVKSVKRKKRTLGGGPGQRTVDVAEQKTPKEKKKRKKKTTQKRTHKQKKKQTQRTTPQNNKKTLPRTHLS